MKHDDIPGRNALIYKMYKAGATPAEIYAFSELKSYLYITRILKSEKMKEDRLLSKSLNKAFIRV